LFHLIQPASSDDADGRRIIHYSRDLIGKIDRLET
jgi:hypothetical protein